MAKQDDLQYTVPTGISYSFSVYIIFYMKNIGNDQVNRETYAFALST